MSDGPPFTKKGELPADLNGIDRAVDPEAESFLERAKKQGMPTRAEMVDAAERIRGNYGGPGQPMFDPEDIERALVHPAQAIAIVTRIVEQVDVSWFGIPMDVKVDDVLPGGGIRITARMVVRDRDNGRMTIINHAQVMPLFMITERYVLGQVHGILEHMVRHELKEQFRYQGTRVFDTHEKKPDFLPSPGVCKRSPECLLRNGHPGACHEKRKRNWPGDTE